MSDDTKRALRTRLRRIAGQVAGIQRMIDDDRYCVDVLLQIAAAQAALDRAGKVVLEAHVESCVSDALSGGSARARRKKIDELMEVFSRFGQIRAR
jgi:DNA-binding FrmR family transcriptional regulator